MNYKKFLAILNKKFSFFSGKFVVLRFKNKMGYVAGALKSKPLDYGKSRTDFLLEKCTGSAFGLMAPEVEWAGGLWNKDNHEKQQNMKTLILMGSYRGFSHSTSMPVRGQSTHTNAKTSRKRKMN